jgi:hypothetical protein
VTEAHPWRSTGTLTGREDRASSIVARMQADRRKLHGEPETQGGTSEG